MKRLGFTLVASGLALAPLAYSGPASSELPLYCKYRPTRGLTPDQEEICKGDTSNRKKQEEAADALKPPKYPFKAAGYLMVNPSTGKQQEISLESEDGSKLRVGIGKNEELMTLTSSEILSWKSAHGGSGTDASGAISTAVAGALFFWPMMLAAPFMVRNYTVTSFQIDYIDELGYDKSLNFATISPPKSTIELLRFSTGMEPGTRRDSEVIKNRYKLGLETSMTKLNQIRAGLIETNSKKPWCSTLRLKPNDEKSASYTSMLSHVNNLRKKLDLSLYSDPVSSSSDSQWQAYLSSNPGLKQWADKYKSQANRLKSCGTT